MSVTIAVPVPDTNKLGALVAVPPVVPNTHVLVMAASTENPPRLVPVQVKPVAFAMFNTVCAGVVDRASNIKMDFDPNAIDRALVLLELKIPVPMLKPLRSRVPAVNVVVLLTTSSGLSPSVSVPPGIFTPMPPSTLLN